jgi:hypothetical protein
MRHGEFELPMDQMPENPVRLETKSAGGDGPLEAAKRRYLDFLGLCRSPDGSCRLTPASDPSAFATCFWVFGMHLIRQDDVLSAQRAELSQSIRRAVRHARAASAVEGRLREKSYRQLLAFSLSALSVLGTLREDPLEELVAEQLPKSIKVDLDALGCLLGRAQSGNQAMFLAIFLLHARDCLAQPVDDQIEAWVQSHLAAMNRFGFWGGSRGMTVLQFQNGYHQYEILEYLGVETGKAEIAANAVAGLADRQGHFAPYPGGGGCFDYDAIFALTPHGKVPTAAVGALLRRTAATLLSEQQDDGGFCENLYVRPRSAASLFRTVRHVADALPRMPMAWERCRYAVALQRRKYDRIETHWSKYRRAWSESDLWDSWFRMLALARIECALNEKAASNWGFIDFPGIGFHPLRA